MDNVADMEGDSSFTATLSEAVTRRQQQIQNEELPKLRERLRVFQAALQSIINVMIRKGLIQEDPYKAEQKISDIEVPEDTEFPDSNQVVVMGIRLSQLDNILEFVNSYVELSIPALGFTELKKLTDLVRYITWDDLRVNSPRPTTQSMAQLMSKLKAGADSLASGILSSAVKQLGDGSREIVDRLKVIRQFQRERYKLELRMQVFPSVEDAGNLTVDDDPSLQRVRSAFSQSGMRGPFVPELAAEVIAEDRGSDGARLRSEVLARLHVADEHRKQKKDPETSFKQLLVDTIRSLSAASRSLDGILERVRENATILQSRKRTLGQRLRAWIEKLSNRGPAPRIYHLEFMDDATGTRHRESVDLDAFLEKLRKKALAYGNILARSGSLWTKIQKANEDQLYQFINKELGDVHLIHRRATAFDAYFKAQATRDEKLKLRGIKIELTTIQNALAKASQLKHEYVSRKEEEEQLKKLGIKSG